MNRLADVFHRLREKHELAFVPYQTAGFPTPAESLDNLERLCGVGADIIELGIPFSDPMADGPTVQYSSTVALERGTTLSGILAALKQRRYERPIVMMSYLNPLMAYGRIDTGKTPAPPCLDALMADCAAAGVAGLIIPDLPHDEAEDWLAAARQQGLAIIFLIAPTSTDERIRQVAERSDGFIYAVSLTGTTGSRESLSDRLPAFLERVRRITDKPIVVGFGISRPEHVTALHGLADGVIVASRLLDAIRRNEPWLELAAELKAATRRPPC